MYDTGPTASGRAAPEHQTEQYLRAFEKAGDFTRPLADCVGATQQQTA
jgi:hypothetical protein